MKLTLLSTVGIACALTLFCGADEFLFKDDFAGKLGPGWTWVREDTRAWRATDSGLEIRVLPGNLWGPANTARNLLLRPAPDTAPGEVEVSVTITNQPTHQYEQVNLAWYYDDSHMVKLGLELVNAQVCIVMGREAADKTRTLAKIPINVNSVRVRLLISGAQIRGQYLPAGSTHWLDAGAGDLPAPPQGRAQISLHCYQGPADAEHWARLNDFQVRRVPRQPHPLRCCSLGPTIEQIGVEVSERY